MPKKNDIVKNRLLVWKTSREKFLSMVFPRRIVNDLLANFSFANISLQLQSQLGIYIYGEVGAGKTLFACYLLEQVMREEFLHDGFNSVRYKFITVPELLLEIRDSFSEKSNRLEKEIVETYSDVEYLILDDLGVEKVTDWSMQTLYLIVNRRYEQLKPTIVTSNYSLNELSDRMQDKRIASRLLAMCKVIKLKGTDKRRR